MKPRRPFLLSLLAIAFLLFAVNGFIRFGAALANWDVLTAAGMRPGPIYPALTGAAYGLSGLAAALGLWLGWQKAGRLARGLALFYAAWYWIDKLFIATNPIARTNWPAALLITGGLLAAVFGCLQLHRVRLFLHELNRENEHAQQRTGN